MIRLGRNRGGYHGERVVVADVLAACKAAGERHGWKWEVIQDGEGPGLPVLTRLGGAGEGRPRLYFSAGIHGDEPAGIQAMVHLLERDVFGHDTDVWLCPCLNPVGCREGTRENGTGRDLNRDYREPSAPEVQAHVAWLRRQPSFDVAFCLHEDWESHGFYLYELNPEGRPSLAEAMVEAVRPICPIDMSEEIEGRPAQNGVIRPSLDPVTRPEWPEAFYLLQHKTRQSYTLEASSDFALETRTLALVRAVEAALSRIRAVEETTKHTNAKRAMPQP